MAGGKRSDKARRVRETFPTENIPMKNILLTTFAASLLAGTAQANDKKLETLLDKAFAKEQARIFKGRDKDRDGKMDRGEFTSLYGEGGAKRWLPVFDKHAGRDKALDLKEFTAVRRDIHLGGGNGERPVALETRFKFSRQGKMFRTYDKSGDGKVTNAEWARMFEGKPNAARLVQFKSADGNKDGALDRIEFLEMLLSPPRRER